MATARQKSAVHKNIRKTRRSKSATRPATAHTKTTAQSKTRTKARAKSAKAKTRARSATRPRGFFHIEVQPKEAFVEFRTHDLGSGIERVAGKRAGGSWSTQEWLIAKDQAHVERGTLIGDTVDARRVLTLFGAEPRHIKADRFTIHGLSGMPAEARPTMAPRRAGLTNVQAPQKGRKWG